MVSISHPQTQHSRKLAVAISSGNLLSKFYTSLCTNPKKFWYLPSKIKFQISKGYDDQIPEKLVDNFFIYELLWRFSSLFISNNLISKANYYNMWAFDSIVASKLKRDNCSIIIGFENSSMQTFYSAKANKMLCILDAASVHYKHQMKYYKPNFSQRFIERINYKKEKEIECADYIVTLSSFAASTYKEFCPAKKIITIPLGVDTAKFTFKAKKNTDEYFRFLFVGNITYAKGIDLLIEAFNKINNESMKLIVAGAKGDAFHLLSKDARIEYAGKLSQFELNSLYLKCNVLILPSRLDGFGMVVTEAMATGTPVIVSTHTGAKDLIQHNFNGWIFEDGNVNELKNTIINIYENKQHLDKIGLAASASVKDFSWQNYNAKTLDFYTNLTKKVTK